MFLYILHFAKKSVYMASEKTTTMFCRYKCKLFDEWTSKYIRIKVNCVQYIIHIYLISILCELYIDIVAIYVAVVGAAVVAAVVAAAVVAAAVVAAVVAGAAVVAAAVVKKLAINLASKMHGLASAAGAAETAANTATTNSVKSASFIILIEDCKV